MHNGSGGTAIAPFSYSTEQQAGTGAQNCLRAGNQQRRDMIDTHQFCSTSTLSALTMQRAMALHGDPIAAILRSALAGQLLPFVQVGVEPLGGASANRMSLLRPKYTTVWHGAARSPGL